jgi:hypothetical protein
MDASKDRIAPVERAAAERLAWSRPRLSRFDAKGAEAKIAGPVDGIILPS